ncbi:MAG: hypothetical protein FWF56_05205 [Firmicutes bacterium]|nr:hypothetical protein [Bacillota bacterium]MCL1953805.1 hypothetical protein [Bacillota bacterium]
MLTNGQTKEKRSFNHGEKVYKDEIDNLIEKDRDGYIFEYWTDSRDDFDLDVFELGGKYYAKDDLDGNGVYFEITKKMDLFAVWRAEDENYHVVLFDANTYDYDNVFHDILVEDGKSIQDFLDNNDGVVVQWLKDIEDKDYYSWHDIQGDKYNFDKIVIQDTVLWLKDSREYDLNIGENVDKYTVNFVIDGKENKKAIVKGDSFLEIILKENFVDLQTDEYVWKARTTVDAELIIVDLDIYTINANTWVVGRLDDSEESPTPPTDSFSIDNIAVARVDHLGGLTGNEFFTFNFGGITIKQKYAIKDIDKVEFEFLDTSNNLIFKLLTRSLDSFSNNVIDVKVTLLENKLEVGKEKFELVLGDAINLRDLFDQKIPTICVNANIFIKSNYSNDEPITLSNDNVSVVEYIENTF